MAISITDRDGNRVFTIDAGSTGCPGSVFILGPEGFCMEFNRADIIGAFKAEFGIQESLMTGIERYLEAVA